MGFQGQLASVNLTDIFQTLQMNRQTGTLSVTNSGAVAGAAQVVHVFFEGGQIAMGAGTLPGLAGSSLEGKATRPFLLTALIHRGCITSEQSASTEQRLRATGQPLRELLLASGLVPAEDLDEASAWCIEELVCPIFEWREGEFTFTDGEPAPPLRVPDVVAMGDIRMATTQVVLEATRRMDEWRRIREVITDAATLYVVDNDGRANLRNVQTDPDMLKVLRYLDGRHTLDAIAEAVGVTRFDTFAIAAQLVLGGIARPRQPQEIVDDANALRAQGEAAQARDLLENTLRTARVPEVLRPLAELSAQLNQAPRAVELFLELIQAAQDQGDLPQALKDLDTVLALSPADPELHFERAQILAELGQIEPSATAYTAAAQAFLNTRDVPRAVDACHRAKNQLPRAPEPHRWLAKAYLLDGQTDNAVVEYKALWHALLTADRPRKALDQLKSVLDTDCKYPAVKDQVLNHAQHSEAIKTNKATRVLVQVATLVVLGAALWGGWVVIEKEVIAAGGLRKFTALDAGVAERKQRLDHLNVLSDIERLRVDYGRFAELDEKLKALAANVRDDYEHRAASDLEHARALMTSGRFDDAIPAARRVAKDYPSSEAATHGDTLIETIGLTRVADQVGGIMNDAQRRWSALDWTGALASLSSLLARNDLSPDTRATVAALSQQWTIDSRSATKLGERAARIESQGDRRAALTAWRQAGAGEGEAAAETARARASVLELELAADLGSAAQAAATRGDAAAFTTLDDLLALGAQSASKDVAGYLQSLELPATLQVDSHHTTLTLKQPGKSDQIVRAPAGVKGSWTYPLRYRIHDTITIEATRTGFALAQPIALSTALRSSVLPVQLTRGPSWTRDLSGGAGRTAPTVAGRQVLLPTERNTIEVVDPVNGDSRPVLFPDTVGEFITPPVVYQNRAYAVVDDRIVAFDPNTRARLWIWPTDNTPVQSRMRLNGLFSVQEHELIHGQLLIFLGTAKHGLITIAADTATGTVTPYPALDGATVAEPTAVPIIDHPGSTRAVLYAASANGITAFDITALTETSAAKVLYTLPTRGDPLGRPVKATVAGRASLLISDSSGLVMAIDADPGQPEPRRVVGSWPVEGTQPSTPAALPGSTLAYVTVGEGRVYALDLGRPGQLAWRFPAARDQRTASTLAPAVGGPAIGLRGLYVADTAGRLRCLDLRTGAERWHADLGSPACGGVSVGDGRVFVPVKSGKLLCFEEGDD